MNTNLPCPICNDGESKLWYSETSRLLKCKHCGKHFALELVGTKELLMAKKDHRRARK
jgi:transposase-like protein